MAFWMGLKDEEDLYKDIDPRIIQLFVDAGIGAGEDPIGFLLASYKMIMDDNKMLRKAYQEQKELLAKAYAAITLLENRRK